MVTIDLRKAFDSVSHYSIRRAFRRAGAPDRALNLIKQFYANASTEIRRDTVIQVNRGVRQGDPLSPFLFNTVIDEALCEVRNQFGGGDLPPVLAFADDVVLVSRHVHLMQKMIDTFIEVLKPTGLECNAKKCSSLTLISDPRRKLVVVDPTTNLSVDGVGVRALNAVDEFRYLGVMLSHAGTQKIRTPPQLLQEGLGNIRDAPLKPEQRLRILREFLTPKLQHTLVMCEVSKAALKRMDVTIRDAVRSWLHLPKDATKAFMHASVSDGGLGVPSFAASVPLWRKQRLDRATLSTHPYSELIRSSSYLRVMKTRANRLGIDASVSNKTQLRSYWRNALYSTVDGNGLREHGQGPHVLDWVRGNRRLRGASFVRAVHVLGGLLPTAARCHRGDREGRTRCEAGCRRPETLAHISQVCPRTADARIHRHDKLVNFVAARLQEIGHRVLVEPAIPTSAGVRRPDLVVVNSAAKQTTIVDAQVVSDATSLDEAHRRKRANYEQSDIATYAASLHPTNDATMAVTTVTFNWRGAMSAACAKDLRDLGLRINDFRRLSSEVLLGTAGCWWIFNRSTARASALRSSNYGDWMTRRMSRQRHPRRDQG